MRSIIRRYNKFITICKSYDQFLCLLVLIGLVLCSFKLLYLTRISLHTEEGFSIIAGFMIRRQGVPLFPSGNLYYQAILTSYIYAILSRLAGDHLFIFRFFSIIAHFVTPIIIYLTARGFLKKEILFVSGICYYLHSWSTEFSRNASPHIFLQSLITLSIIFFIGRMFLEYKNNSFVVLFILAGFLSPLSFSLVSAFMAYLLLEPAKFIEKRTYYPMSFFIAFFTLIVYQENLFSRVGIVNLNTRFSGFQNIVDFLAIENLVNPFRMLIDIQPISFVVFISGFFIMSIKYFYYKNDSKKLETNDHIMLFLMIMLILMLIFHGSLKTYYIYDYSFSLFHLLIIVSVSVIYRFGMFPFRYFERLWKIFKSRTLKTSLLLVFSFFIIDNVGIKNNMGIIFKDFYGTFCSELKPLKDYDFPLDQESVGGYVSRNRDDNDIVIAVEHIVQYFYAGNLDFWLWSGESEICAISVDIDREACLGIPIIRDLVNLLNIINVPGRRVWIITSPSFYDPFKLSYDIINFLSFNQHKIKWLARDGKSKVYLFDNTDTAEKEEKFVYQARWGIYNHKGHDIYNTDYIEINRRRKYATAPVFDSEGPAVIRLWFNEDSPLSRIRTSFMSKDKIHSVRLHYLDEEYIDLSLDLKNRVKQSLIIELIEGPPVYIGHIEFMD